jgi:hypothetical protein
MPSVVNSSAVTIDLCIYTQLIEANFKLNMIKGFAEADSCSYGYSEHTSKGIDKILGISRSAENK